LSVCAVACGRGPPIALAMPWAATLPRRLFVRSMFLRLDGKRQRPAGAAHGLPARSRINAAFAAVLLVLLRDTLAPCSAQAQTPAFAEGVQLSTPPGWMPQASDSERVVFLGPDGLSQITVSVDRGDLNALAEGLGRPIALGGGDLLPLSIPSRSRDYLSNTFVVSGFGPLTQGLIMAQAAPSGRLLVASGLTQKGMEPALRRAMTSVFASARLPASRSLQPEDRPERPSWRQQLPSTAEPSASEP